MSKLLDRIRLASDLNKAIFLLLIFFAAFLCTHDDHTAHWCELFIGIVAMGLRSEMKAAGRPKAASEEAQAGDS